MINKSNYFTQISKVGISNLTPTLSQGHSMLEKITKDGSNWDVASPTLSKVIENQFKLLEMYLKSNETKSNNSVKKKNIKIKEKFSFSDGFKWAIIDRKTAENLFKQDSVEIFKLYPEDESEALIENELDLLDPEAMYAVEFEKLESKFQIEIQKSSKAKVQVSKNNKKGLKKLPVIQEIVIEKKIKAEIKKPKVATVNSRAKKVKQKKETKPAIVIRKMSLELQHVKRYLKMEGKKIKTSSLVNLSNSINTAIASESYLTHKSLLNEISSKLSSACEKLKETGQETVDVNLTPEFKTKCQDILSQAKVRIRTEYLAGLDQEVYIDTYRKKYVLVAVQTNQKWANENFTTIDEAEDFAVQNNLKVVDKPEHIGCDCEKKK